MISVVCVYNRNDILNKYLLKSLNIQTSNYELILLDNTTGKYSSAAEALNTGGEKASGDFIMFVHQDVDLSYKTFLEEAEEILKYLLKKTDLGVAGIAGKNHLGATITLIKHGEPPLPAGGIFPSAPTKVQTLDECLFVVPKDIFDEYKLDPKTCDGWHLYAVDYCLTLNSRSFDIYVIPLHVYHLSPGYSMSEDYYRILKKVIKKHKVNFDWIFTAMGDWHTKIPLSVQLKFPQVLKYLKESYCKKMVSTT